jgi:PKHD-type hydroxylase
MIYQNYVWIAEAFFTSQEVDSIIACANKIEWEEGRVGFAANDPDSAEASGRADDEIRRSSVKWLTHEMLPQEFHEKLAQGVQFAQGDNAWTWDLSHFENFQFTQYSEQPNTKGDFYTWHTDSGHVGQVHGTEGLIRKLSCTIQLSDPDEYEGGHFEWLEPHSMFDRIKQGDKSVGIDAMKRTAPFSAKTRGSILLFPSDVHHQVTPVTRGARTSLVGWLLGTPFK